MRRATLISCVAHALLVLGLAWLGSRAQRAGAAPGTPAPGTLEIEIVPPAASMPAASMLAPPAPSIESAPAQPRPAPRARVAALAPPRPGPMPAPGAPVWLAMRDADRPYGSDERGATETARVAERPLNLSPAHAARSIAPDPGPPPSSPLVLPGAAPAAPDLRDAWAPPGGGTYRADDLAFTARIARDGQVTIDDTPSFQLSPRLPRLAAEDDDPASSDTALGSHTTFLKMDVATFDATDWLMRSAGVDPYAARKARFLDHTRDARAAMRARARSEDLRDAIAALPGLLDAIWRDPVRSSAERRALLFRMWDECTETGADELARAGRTARATIIGFIRRALPPGSRDAYSEVELEPLNAARKSTEPFAPYP